MGEIVATKEIEGVTLTVDGVRPYQGGYYRGFARFDDSPLGQMNHEILFQFIPVHGGVTFAGRNDDGDSVYGFHCAHPGDDQDLDCLRKAWVLEEAERMALSIIALGTIEKQIVAAMDEIWDPSSGSKE